ncbi:serine/threonine-protein kinase ATR-like [Ochlerotatus camptorhynchus]|uniref:serine/threonine-protein kinase ATR-like n=1 Tax=Ochlerotatus camptorhynchus TaxID=644619 RepID=UPI0031E1425C
MEEQIPTASTSKQDKKKSGAMWETLIPTLIDKVNKRSSYLEKILDMIRRDLTYDNPGLFPTTLLATPKERDPVKACNFWLINHLLYVASIQDFFSIKKNNIELQKAIISASFVKQIWFLYDAADKYLVILDQLNSINSEMEPRLEHFHMPDHYFVGLDCACVFAPIVVGSKITKVALTENCLHVLSQVVSLVDDSSNRSIRERSAKSVMKTLNQGSLDEKTLSIMFFGQFLKLISVYTSDLEHLVGEILSIVETTLERFNRWLSSEIARVKSLEQFKTALVDFYSKLNGLKYGTYQSEQQNKLFQCSINIIKNLMIIEKDAEDIKLKLLEQISRFMGGLLNQCMSGMNCDLFDDIFSLSNQFPDLLSLLEVPITNELIAAKNLDEVSTLKQNHFWNRALDTVEDDECKKKTLQKLYLRQKIIHLAVNVTFNYSCWSQREYNRTRSVVAFYGSLQPFLQKLFQDLLEVAFNTDIILLVLDVCFDSILLKDFASVDVDFQKHICSWFLLPYEPLVTNSVLSVIPENLKKKYYDYLQNSCDIQLIKTKSLDQLCTLSFNNINESVSDTLKTNLWTIITSIASSGDLEQTRILHSFYTNLLLSFKYPPSLLAKEMLLISLRTPELRHASVQNLNAHVCMKSGNFSIFEIKRESTLRRKYRCFVCKPSADDTDIACTQTTATQKREPFAQSDGVRITPKSVTEFSEFDLSVEDLELLYRTEDNDTRVEMAKMLPVLLKHSAQLVTNEQIVQAWSGLITCNLVEVCITFSKTFPMLMEYIMNSSLDSQEKDKIIQTCLDKLLQAVKLSLKKSDYNYQSAVMNMLVKFATCDGLSEERLMHCLRMLFFFLMLRESEVSREATLAAGEMCGHHGVSTLDMLHWYRHDTIKLMTAISATNYCCYNASLHKSLYHISRTFQFSGPVKFVTKYYKIILAMLLPWCVKRPKCEHLLQELANMTRRDKKLMLSGSFLTIYPYLFINEPANITNQCIDYIMTNTGITLVHLLHSDIKKTVAEILIFYHINAECVLHAFRSLLAKDDAQDITTAQMAEYIFNRFLGVLTFFEATLINPETEKVMKRETLHSLGEIIRLLGGHHITPFRFKIIALLKTALSFDEANFKDICIKVWRIFICTVDVEQLGSLLSSIFVSLVHFIDQFPEDINYIFHYLVVQNNSLLSQHIPDLFFLDETEVDEDIKRIVAVHTKTDRERDQFLVKFTELIKQVNHENLSVRVFGLKYLKRLFSCSRIQVNDTIIGQLTFNPMVESLLDNLIKSCSDIDTNYRLRAAECIGELGALAPSYLPPNYAPQDSFALSIHSDAFASMALAELCRAYQFQKDTKLVDSFSLAIQEILGERGVSPKTGKKLEVWEAIPERLRPIMEPLLTSCYTGLTMTTTIECHPIFGSSKAQSCQEWAYLWACQMIEHLEKDHTQTLLKSFKPSIRCDISTMTMFLPYILLHAIQGSSEDYRKKMVEELQFLFNAIMNNNPEIDSPEQQDHYVRGLRTLQFKPEDHKAASSDTETSDMSNECAKFAFSLLDFLEKWKRQWRKVYQLDDSKTDFHNVDGFLSEFDHEMLANINFKCNEYARSLMYLEAFIEDDPSRLQQHLFFLAKIFTHLNDPDSVEGVMCLKTTEPTLAEQILLHNATGRLHQTAACYERMLQVGDVSPRDIHNMVECYLSLDQPETALLLSESLLNKYYESNVHSLLQEIKAEPLYRLSRFEELEELLESPSVQDSDSWGVICGSLMISYRKNNHDQFKQRLEQARLAVLKILRNSDLKISAYEKGYEQVLKLHMITEFEKCEQVLNNVRSNGLQRCHADIKNLIENFESRLELLQPAAATVEPIINLRRILLKETKILINGLPTSASTGGLVKEINETIDSHIGELWIKSTELASRAKLFEQAHLYILHAESYKPKELFIKKAKLLWEKRDVANVFKVLERGLAEILQLAKISEPKQLPKDDKMIFAQGKLLIAIYNADSSNVSTSINQKCFKEAVLAYPESETCMVHLAQYLDKLHANFSSDDQDSTRGWELLQDVMTYYGKSMMYGSTYIYQSMPRVLSIWLDFTSRGVNNDSYRKICSTMNKLAQRFSETLSPYFFFTAFSQLMSRVAHPSVEVFQVLKSIIVKLILTYPQQSLWMLLSVYKSSYTNRVKRCNEIFHDKKLAKTSMQKMITDFNALAEKFIELTNKDLGSSKETKGIVSSVVKSLPKLFSDGVLSDIMMPIQKCMQLVLDKNSTSFSSYPMNLVYIHGIREEFTILQSLQKPRKITLVGHDGREYTMMMKPKDDLRKDFRLMEFNAVVKQYLYKDPDAKHRRLNIRTYTVLPLNEECGIIEWVENLNTFRSIICTYYKQRGKGMAAKELRNYNFKRQEPLQKKRDAYLNVLLPRHPSVFGEWFRDRFSNPHNWFQARSSYIRTTAVISIVGYILGLGDRHGENILFDATNGDTVHVDFNCLFNKGETFEVPELVPFRLTHNMVKAMGPLGVEGLYRKCCEITLRVLQNQTPTFMSVLKPFVYDPLVSWSKITKHDGTTERTDPQAMNNVKHIEERLKGYVRIHGKTSQMPLSVEGQVNHLISEATNQDNLAQMYIGWAGYM